MEGFLLVFDLDGTLVDSVPDLRAALNDMLRGRGHRTAICTNKPQRATLAVLQGLDLLPLFDGIAGGDRFAVRKPDPGHLSGLIAELGAGPGESAMIGDNENDAAAARAVGVPLVLMRYGYARIDPESLNADALLDHFSELPQALERLGLTP